MRAHHIFVAISLTCSLVGCAGVTEEGDADEAADADLDDGKGDGHALDEGTPEALGVLRAANELTRGQLHADVGLTRRAAGNITIRRAGADGTLGTGDDVPISSIRDLDAIPYIGPASISKLLEYAEAHDMVNRDRVLLLRYDYGNQITRSRLEIFSDNIWRQEERYSPTDVQQVAQEGSAEDLAELREMIAGAAAGQIYEKDGGPTTLGSSSGELIVVGEDGEEIVIARITRDTDGDGLDEFSRNLSVEGAQLFDLVLSTVERDMPRS